MSALGLSHSPTAEAPEENYYVPTSPTATTRTVAIIKNHALNHRFDIEHRISEAGFEIVKERQMEFDVESDPDTLYELFGADYESFAEGPVWVYVLERRRAVEMWNALMGHPDPEEARQDTPSSLRALYGASLLQNAVMGAPDPQTAEIQIQAIFASSPPFPPTELPDVEHDVVPVEHSVSSSVLSRRRGTSDEGYLSSTMSPTESGAKKPSFKARPLPTTHVAPDIVPRMSRAASLRAGINLEKPVHAPPTKERLAETFANVPGHKRSVTITVASTAPPAVAPRMTRAAALRLGQAVATPAKPKRPSTANGPTPETSSKATFDGVPGHKRRESIAVASTKAPTVAPKTNRSALLRQQQKEAAPPSSFMFRGPSNQKAPSRSSSRASLDAPGSARPNLSRPASAASVKPPSASRPAPATVRASISGPRPSLSSARPALRQTVAASSNSNPPTDTANALKPKPKPRPSSIQPPPIVPRTNKSALLRAAKMAATKVATAGKPASASTLKAVRA